MQRRALLAAPALALLPGALLPGALLPGVARAQAALVTEEYWVPAGAPGAEAFLRSKRPEQAAGFAPGRTLLFVHNALMPGHTSFDLPLAGVSWMDYVAGRGFDVWSLDLPGFGRASRLPEQAQPAAANPPALRGEAAAAALAAAIAFIREKRGVPRLALIGWGWGAALAGRYAQENAVERLVLLNPEWLRAGGAETAPLPAWRGLTQPAAREAWLAGVPAAARQGLIPAGWFEHWAGVTWATDPEGQRSSPAQLRLPNGPLADARESWQAGRPWWEPGRVTVPVLVLAAEWDAAAPAAGALGLFGALAASPGRRLTVLGEGTQNMMLERNRGALYQAVQVFLEEGG